MSESLFERYEKGERSLYNFNGELKTPNRWVDTERFDEYVRRFLASSPFLQNLDNTRGVGFANSNSIPIRGQSIGRIIRDEVYTWP